MFSTPPRRVAGATGEGFDAAAAEDARGSGGRHYGGYPSPSALAEGAGDAGRPRTPSGPGMSPLGPGIPPPPAPGLSVLPGGGTAPGAARSLVYPSPTAVTRPPSGKMRLPPLG